MWREHERARKDLERSDDGQRPPVAGPAADLLALQRTVGNRAVGALLSRDPKPKAPSKDAPAATGNRVVFPGVGTIPVESVNMGGQRSMTNPTGSRREEPAPSISEVFVTSKQGDHSTALFGAFVKGKAADVEVILQRGEESLVMKLSNAIVSAYNVSGQPPLESWTLSASSVEFRREGGEEERGD